MRSIHCHFWPKFCPKNMLPRRRNFGLYRPSKLSNSGGPNRQVGGYRTEAHEYIRTIRTSCNSWSYPKTYEGTRRATHTRGPQKTPHERTSRTPTMPHHPQRPIIYIMFYLNISQIPNFRLLDWIPHHLRRSLQNFLSYIYLMSRNTLSMHSTANRRLICRTPNVRSICILRFSVVFQGVSF